MKWTHILLLILCITCIGSLMSCSSKWRSQPQDYYGLVDPHAVAYLELIPADVSGNKSMVKKYGEMLQKAENEKDSVTYSYLAYHARTFYTNLDSVLVYNKRALAYLDHHSEYPVPLVHTCFNLGLYGLANGRNVYEASYYLNRGASIVISSGLDTAFPKIWLQRAFINTVRQNRVCGQFEMAQRYLYKTIELTRKTISAVPEDYMGILSEAAQLFSESGALDSARRYLDLLAVEQSRLNAHKMDGAIYGANAEYYMCRQQYDSSLFYYLKALAYNDTCNCSSSYLVYNDYLAVIKLYSIKGQPENAARYMTNIMLAYSVRDSSQQLTGLEHLIYYYIAAGDNKTAQRLFTEYHARRQAAYNTDRLKMQAAVNEEFGIEEKSRKIANLYAEKNMTASELRLKNRFIFALIIVSLLVGIIFYLLLRQRKFKAQQQILEAHSHSIEIEQQLLRTQMEPHFIFNTLAVLQSQVRSGDTERAGKYLNRFARLLRLSLENSRQKNVPLAQEVDALENYLALQAMRFEDMFTYEINVYDGYNDDNVLIPPMLFQPFVENAIHHGLRNIDHQGHLSIVIEKRYKVIYCCITDNGKGFNETTQDIQKQSLSTKITRERLDAIKKQTGINTLLQISTSPKGTVIEIVVPFSTGAQL